MFADMSRILRDLWHNESGATAVEYALIGVVVGIGIIGALQSVGTALQTMLEGVGNYLTSEG